MVSGFKHSISQTKVQIAAGALIAATLFSFSHVANASELTAEKSPEVVRIEAEISTLKKQRSQLARHEQKDLLPQFDKGGPDWKPIDAIVMHELDQEIRDYHFLRANGQAAQSGEMHDQMVDLLISSKSFEEAPEAALDIMSLALTDKRQPITPLERKVFLNRMRYQLGTAESKHLKALLDDLQSTRSEMSKADRSVAKLNEKLQKQLEAEAEEKAALQEIETK